MTQKQRAFRNRQRTLLRLALTMPEFSQSQQELIDHLRAGGEGATIRRYPGGFWGESTPLKMPRDWHPEPWWGVATVRALITRGVLVGVSDDVVPEWKESYRLAPLPID